MTPDPPRYVFETGAMLGRAQFAGGLRAPAIDRWKLRVLSVSVDQSISRVCARGRGSMCGGGRAQVRWR